MRTNNASSLSSGHSSPRHSSSKQSILNKITQSYLKKDFRYWQWRILFSLIFGYAAFYLVRQNLPVAMTALSAEFGYTKTELGWITTSFAIVYGVGKAISGTFSDRSNARYFMSIGLFLSACACFFVGMTSSFYPFLFLWILNACFQSMGSPPCQRLLTHWFPPTQLGTRWAIWNSSHQIGTAIVTVVAGAYLIEQFGWRSVFFVPAVVVMVCAFLLFQGLRDTPESLGFSSIEEHTARKNNEALPPEPLDANLSFKDIFVKRVLKNHLVWYMCWANLFFYIVRFGLLTWAPSFLTENKGSSLAKASWDIAGFDFAAIFGGIIAGYLSDKIFEGRRGPVGVIFMMILMMLLLYLWQIPQGSRFLNAFVMFAIGFFVSGPQILQGVAAADFASKRAAGAANGLTGTFGYLGAAFSGVGIGKIVDVWGWNAAFVIFAVSALISAFFFALTWNHKAPKPLLSENEAV